MNSRENTVYIVYKNLKLATYDHVTAVVSVILMSTSVF